MNNKQRKEKIAAVVVTYNRKELLKKCLEGLLNQTHPLDEIVLIDNASTDGTPEFLQKNGYLGNPKIDYTRLTENTGGSGGFYEGVKRGYKKGYDWLWLMDDDVEAHCQCLENLLEVRKLIFQTKKDNLFVLACRRDWLNDGLVEYDCKKINLSNPFSKLCQNYISENDLRNLYVSIEAAAFEGLLLSRQIIELVGFPDKRFFIFADDTDYCLRILQKDSKIYYIPSARIARLIQPTTHKKHTWKSYYEIRNTMYIELKYSKLHFKLIRIPLRMIKLIFGRLINRNPKNIFVIFRASIDAIRMHKTSHNYFT